MEGVEVLMENASRKPDNFRSLSERLIEMDLVTSFFHLLSDYCVCFDDGMITWDGHHHAATGLHVDNEKVPELTEFATQGGFDDLNDYLNCFVDGFLNNLVEADEDLIVPRRAIHEALYPMLQEGDLTGLVLADFCGCNKALVIDNPAPDSYRVMYDTRIARGIPQFFNLIARMVWDMRQGLRSQQGVSFNVTFVAVKNIDLSMLVVDDVTDVLGMQENPGSMTVYAAPKIRLDARNGSETVSASAALENESDAPGKKSRGVDEKPQPFQPKSWAEDETRDRVYALADRCNEMRGDFFDAKVNKARRQRELDSIVDDLNEAISKHDLYRSLEREREKLACLRSDLDDEVAKHEKELQSFGLFDISNKRQTKKKLSELAERIKDADSSLKAIEGKLSKGPSELAKAKVDELRQQESDARLAFKEAEANFEQIEAEKKERRAKLEAFCASVPKSDRFDECYWDADWQMRQACDRKRKARTDPENKRLAKQFAQTVDIGEVFTLYDMMDAVDGIETFSKAGVVCYMYDRTHSVKKVAPINNRTAYVLTDKRFMDIWDD